jgi:hypothetical protein
VFLSIECEVPREDSRRDHWHRRNRSQQQVIVGRDSTLLAGVSDTARHHGTWMWTLPSGAAKEAVSPTCRFPPWEE